MRPRFPALSVRRGAFVFIGDLLFLAAALAIVAAIVLGTMGGRRLWRQHVVERRMARRDHAALERRQATPVPSNDAERSEPAIEDAKNA
jgi:hypothetical protein